MYNYRNSKSNIVNILSSKTKVESKTSIPKDQEFTFENGIRAWVGAIFVDIRDSSKIFKCGDDDKIARIMRAFTSEIITIMQDDDKNYRQIGIRGDCVYGIYSVGEKSDVERVYKIAYTVNTFIIMFNKLLLRQGYTQINIGIGLGCSHDLIIKAGRSGTGINDKIWIGDAVVDASNLSNQGNVNGLDPICMSGCFYNNVVKGNSRRESFFKKYSNFYHGNVILTEFDKWIKDGMKDLQENT